MRRTLCIILLFAISESTLSLNIASNVVWEKCKVQQKASEDVLKELRSNPGELFRDPTKRCFMACIFIENKTLNSDGTLDAETFIKTMPDNIFEREKVVEAFKACASETGADVCETAYKSVVCMSSKEEILNIRPVE